MSGKEVDMGCGNETGRLFTGALKEMSKALNSF
jgi:hypothetical protein